MLTSKKTRRGVIGAVVLAGVLAVGGYALTNSITFADASTTAGDGSQTVTTEQVSNIHYNLNATTPTLVDSMVITLATALKTTSNTPTAWVNPNDGASGSGAVTTGWYTCAITSGTTLTCTVDGSGANSHPLVVTDVGSGATAGKVRVVAAD